MTISASILRLAIFFAFTLTACDDTNTQASTKHITTIANQESELDSIEYFPDDTISIAKILATGTFHDDEVWMSAKNENWFGIFKGKNDCYISQTKIETLKVFDPVLDEDSLQDKTGWNVQAINKDTCIVLIAGLDFLKNRKIYQMALTKDQIFPGDTLRFNYSGIDYKLFATGGKKKVQEEPEVFELWNYKLYLAAIKSGQIVTELLVARSSIEDLMIKIIFAGDIDGDGLLDLLIDTSIDGNETSPTLYLSKPADDNHLLKAVGQHSSVGC